MNEVQNNEITQPEVTAPTEPKVLQQHEINALVGGAKQKGREQGKVEGYEQAKAEFMSHSNAQNSQQDSVPPSAVASADNESRLRQIAIEELSKQRAAEQEIFVQQQNQEAGTRILNDLNNRVATAKSKFEDFDKVVKPNFEDFAATPEVLLLAHQFDNSGEMLYDMAKNPTKIAQVQMMIKMKMGQAAFAEMKRLSDSIKVNEMAVNQPKPRSPLSQVSPSNVGVGKTDDNITSNDYRGMY